ncbi:hypothetical protein CVM73_20530 [Bradyrhizobium forestalis]|uniref:Uncharacterized protein n=1 Tax=Bradyrhizobium forestalis TaxID=1419263 RepID=A0A2M8R662_9BRAD|nr:hypothetical protein CVM73_20530 [Bradyrhizobium forestalis]
MDYTSNEPDSRGFVPAIHDLEHRDENVDARDKPGHDERKRPYRNDSQPSVNRIPPMMTANATAQMLTRMLPVICLASSLRAISRLRSLFA